MSDDKIKDALRMMPYGFYAFTTKNGDEVNAMVVNWVSQMSYEPRLVAVGIAKSAYSHGLVKEGEVFGLNLFLAEDKEAIMGVTKGREKNPDKMEENDYTTAPETGVPVLEGSAAYIECKVTQIIDVGGDHDIVVGEAINADVMKEAEASEVLSLPKIGWSYAG